METKYTVSIELCCIFFFFFVYRSILLSKTCICDCSASITWKALSACIILTLDPHKINVRFPAKLAWNVSFEVFCYTDASELCWPFCINKALRWTYNFFKTRVVKCCHWNPLLLWVNCCSMFNAPINPICDYLPNYMMFS